MAFLWLFGTHVEDALGPLSFLALYLGGGLAAGVMHTAIKWLVPAQRLTPASEPLVGASGRDLGHRRPIRRALPPRADPAGLAAGAARAQRLGAAWKCPPWRAWRSGCCKTSWGLSCPCGQGMGGVAYWAHLGGFAFGLIASELGGLMREGRQDYLLQEARAAAPQGQD